MTPEEIDQVAAMRMQVAQLHTALKGAYDALAEGFAATAAGPDHEAHAKAVLRPIDEALQASEGGNLEIIAKARAVVEARRAGDTDSDPWVVELVAAVEDLAKVLP